MNAIALGILGVLFVTALGFVWWEKRQLAEARIALNQAANDLPLIVTGALRFIIQLNPKGSMVQGIPGKEWCGAIDYADVNGDGKKELLLQHPTGAHGSTLKILEWKTGKLEELADLSVGTPAGFDFGDFDGDGKIEIRTEETDWSSGLPYVSAPRLILFFRWNGVRFIEVFRESTVSEA